MCVCVCVCVCVCATIDTCILVCWHIHILTWKQHHLMFLPLSFCDNAVFDDGSVFPPKVLDIAEEDLLKTFMQVGLLDLLCVSWCVCVCVCVCVFSHMCNGTESGIRHQASLKSEAVIMLADRRIASALLY